MSSRVPVAIALWAVCLVAAAAPNDPLVVHEWGTFTSVQGGNGVQIWWAPLVQSDLPDFVYSRAVDNGGISGVTLLDRGEKGSLRGVIRMETPVIYFYSKVERVVDVRVLFPNGLITEWYPQATSVGPYMTSIDTQTAKTSRSILQWAGVRILPQNTRSVSASSLIRDRGDEQANHYYAARETDANFLRVSSPHTRDGAEYERDLFYRGVGMFEAPLSVQVDPAEAALSVSTRSAQPLSSLFVLTIRQGMMRYQKMDSLTAHNASSIQLDAQPFQPLSGARDRIMREMTAELVEQGLYAKEAQAMVDTWKDQWFAEEGTRVLYLLPRTWTDRALPLQIAPQPDSVVRVMVGRAEIIMPSVGRKLSEQILTYNSGDPARMQEAVGEVRKLKLRRFSQPAVQIALGQNPPMQIAFSATRLLAAADAPEPVQPLSQTTH